MRLRVDLAIQDLLGASHGDRRNLSAQLFACTIGFLLDLGVRRGDLPLAFLLATALASAKFGLSRT